MSAQTDDKFQNAREQAQAQFESIRGMVQDLDMTHNSGDGDAEESCRERIWEDALSVEVRSGWYSLGAKDADTQPAEYRILLCTGGPAVQITGELSEYGEPETARLEMQDWFLPWTEYRPVSRYARGDDSLGDAQEILLTYARHFYFGE